MQTSDHPVEPIQPIRSVASSTPRTALRLQLSDAVGSGVLDGAWWPRSRDLQAELADLVEHFPPKSGRIVHAAYSRPDWQPAQRRVKVAGGVVKVGSYPRDDTHQILLGMANRQTLQLMVVPWDLPRSAARWAMQAASTPSNRNTASLLLEDARGRAAVEPAGTQSASRRDDDGGGEWWEPRSALHARLSRG